MLPSFLIIGSQRAGSTSLFSYLRQHPALSLPRRKELHFFDRHFSRGIGWYKRQFPLRLLKRERLTGEATPYYLFHPAVAQRVASTLPDIKLIVLLRDPAARAYSHYQMSVLKGNESIRDFAEALRAEPARLQGASEKLLSDPDYFSFSHQKHSYFSRGLYFRQLTHWMRYFPKSRFHVIQSELFFADAQKELDRLLPFLALEKFNFAEREPLNKNTYSPLEESVRERLAQDYYSPNRDLEDLLGRKFDWS